MYTMSMSYITGFRVAVKHEGNVPRLYPLRISTMHSWLLFHYHLVTTIQFQDCITIVLYSLAPNGDNDVLDNHCNKDPKGISYKGALIGVGVALNFPHEEQA